MDQSTARQQTASLWIQASNLDEIQEALSHAKLRVQVLDQIQIGSTNHTDQTGYVVVPLTSMVAALRHGGMSQKGDLGLEIDSVKRLVSRASYPQGSTQKMTPKELEILMVIFRSYLSIDRESLFRAVWNQEVVGKKTLDVHLFSLRQQLEHIGLEIAWQNGQYHLRARSD